MTTFYDKTPAQIAEMLPTMEDALTNSRITLGKMVAEGDYVEARVIANDVNAIAEKQGEYLAVLRFVRAFDQHGTVAEAMTAVHQMLYTGADDAWSGRTNDVRRAEFDGMVRAVEKLSEVKA